MEIIFRTKEESNQCKEDTFLKLSPADRVLVFFDLLYFFKDFPSNAKSDKKNNFIITIKNKKQRLE